MSNKFAFTGVAQLKTDLKELPEKLTVEADHITEAAANRAAADVKAAYPWRTGNLVRGVMVEEIPQKGENAAGYVVKNTAPHASLFEFGTQARHTEIGANRGSMPPGHVFIRTMVRERREMYLGPFTELLEANGLAVTGDV